jgi:RND family efflux transporter MFP subunit
MNLPRIAQDIVDPPSGRGSRRGRAAGRFVLAAAAAALLAALVAACTERAAVDDPVRAVRTMTVGQASGAITRDYAGEVHARIESRLGFRVPGKVTARPAELGQRVRAGQALAQVDPADLRYGEVAAHAAWEAARVSYQQTAIDYKRYQDLEAQGFISAADLERRNSGLAAAKAQLDQARAQAAMQSNQASYAVLAADAAGVVTAVYADVGTVVGAGAPVLALAHDGPRDVVFAVPEDQLPVFRRLEGQAGGVTVSLWSGGATLPATVREVAAAADAATRTFQVKADIPVGAAELGQTATVHVQLAPADGLLRLPMAAVFGREGADGHFRSFVWLLDRTSMQVREQAVAVARPEGDEIVVADGLKTGDVVVTAGAHVLTSGQKVALWQEPAQR